MGISESLKEGLSLANRNLPVILINLIVAFINLLGFGFFVILPVSIALFIAGVSPFVLTNFYAHEGLIKSLPWVMLFSIFAFVLFLIFSLCVGLFVYSATIGVMIKSKRDPAYKFRFSDFLKEGKKGFFVLFNYLSLTGFCTVLLIAVAVFAGFFLRNLIDYLSGLSVVLSTFIGLFATVVGITIFIALMFLLAAITFYGSIEVCLNRKGAIETFKYVINYLFKEKGGLMFFASTGVIYLAIGFLLVLIGFPCTATPAGILISFPYHFLVYLINSYAGLWALGALVSFYVGQNEEGPAEVASPSNCLTAG